METIEVYRTEDGEWLSRIGEPTEVGGEYIPLPFTSRASIYYVREFYAKRGKLVDFRGTLCQGGRF